MNNFGGFKVKGNQNYVYHSYRKYHPLLCIYDAGILYPDTSYRHTRDMRFASHLFEYIVSGKGYVEYDGRRYTVTAGDCIYIGNKCSVTYYSDSDEPYTKLWFSADGALPGKLCEALGFDGELYIRKRNLYGKFQRLFHVLENDGFELERISKHLIGIMLGIFSEEFADSPEEDGTGIMSEADRMKAYIDTVIESAPTVKDIAEHFGVCEATVIRRFKRAFSQTPNSYIKKQRMSIAESMIRNTDYTVTKISQSLNFCSQSYFSDMFFEEYGMYPSEYRKRIKK